MVYGQVPMPPDLSPEAAKKDDSIPLPTKDVLPDPPHRALVDGLDPSGVRLRASRWHPSQNVDGLVLHI